jgi:peptide chain release factor 2
MARRFVIRPEDVRFEAFRAKGPGGQHRNTTDSAIRATHVPTNLQASATEKSQHQNKAEALRLLEAKVQRMMDEREARDRADDWRAKPDAAFSAQIRTYALCGNAQRVEDHRTGHVERNPGAVLRGKIDGFIFALLRGA